MSDSKGEKLSSSSPNARADFFLEEMVEAGIALTGTEVKSIRASAPNLKDSHVEITSRKKGGEKSGSLEAWLVNVHIGPYSHGNIWNHEARRRRKLLLHAHQIRRLFGALTQEGKTIVPTRMYFSKGRVKIEIALGKGKKKGDKRADLKEKSQKREIEQAMKRNK